MKINRTLLSLILPAVICVASSTLAWSADKPSAFSSGTNKKAAPFASGSSAKPAAVVSSSSVTLVEFGSESKTAGKGKTSGPNAATVDLAETKDGIMVHTPNVWSCLLQYEKIEVDFSETSPKDYLTIQVKGTVTGNNPQLKVLFFTPDWKQKSTWVFDLSKIDPDEYTTIKATTPLNKPLEAPADSTVEFSGVFGIIQIATKAEETNTGWAFGIKSFGFTH